MRLLFAIALLVATSCTINMIQTDTHGVAQDVGDSVTKDDLDANVQIPIKPV